LFEVVKDLRGEHGRNLELVDTGGGFGVDYGQGCSVSPADFVKETRALMAAYGLSDLMLAVEPGRSLVATHGVLLTRVVQQKLSPQGDARHARQRWLMVDAGMNDLLRPALYQARHRIVVADREAAAAPRLPFRVVGPVCESSDDFGAHDLALSPSGRPLLAILDAGAYGYTMASEYNGRALPSEVFLDDGRVALVRRRKDESTWIEERLGGAVPP
jgi:diaminopimelate decarboxylase